MKLNPRRSPIVARWDEKTNGTILAVIEIPKGGLGPELAHLSQQEIRAALDPMVRGLQHGLRQVREARRGPLTIPREILFGRKEEKDPLQE